MCDTNGASQSKICPVDPNLCHGVPRSQITTGQLMSTPFFAKGQDSGSSVPAPAMT